MYMCCEITDTSVSMRCLQYLFRDKSLTRVLTEITKTELKVLNPLNKIHMPLLILLRHENATRKVIDARKRGT